MSLGVDRVMSEGVLYDHALAALAIKQAQCDLAEAVFLLRACRTTLRRFGVTEPIDTRQMQVRRRVATTHKNPPGGQFLGPTYDYTHRLLDFSLLREPEPEQGPPVRTSVPDGMPASPETDAISASPLDRLRDEGLLEPPSPVDKDGQVGDLTREPLRFPAGRDIRLQALARGDEGFVLGLAYAALH